MLIALIASLSASCATIVGDPTQLVPIRSSPDSASVVITDEKDKEVYKGSTPTTVTLEKSDGSYWGGKDYIVAISKPGYKTREISVKSQASAWYVGGNLLFGGLIGWFIVDPMSGNMYTLTPEQVDADLSSDSVFKEAAEDGAISIVLIEDVPASLRDRLETLQPRSHLTQKQDKEAIRSPTHP